MALAWMRKLSKLRAGDTDTYEYAGLLMEFGRKCQKKVGY
jgi:hypothetical protein